MRDAEINFHSVRVAVSCSIGIMLASGTAIIGTFGIFMLPILREFHWGRAQISGVVMTMSCTTALLAPLLGKLQDRWGVRRILLPGIVLYAASVMLLSTARGAIAQFYLLFFFVGVAATLISIVPYTKVISEWFHRTRGIVLALVGAGVSVGASLLPQLARVFIGHFGWRGAYVGIGLLIICVNLPVQSLFLTESPGKNIALPNDLRKNEISSDLWGMTAPEIRKSRTYWTLIASVFLTTFVVGGVLAHLVPMMVDRGIRSVEATNALTLYILGGIAGRLTMGRLLDRFSSPRVVFPFYLIAIAGLIVLYTAKDARVLALSGALIGVCSGAEAEFGPYLHSRYFGLRAFAETYGLQFMFLAVANGLGPVAMGAVYDFSGSYWKMIFVQILLLAVAAGLLLSLRPYAQVADDQKPIRWRQNPGRQGAWLCRRKTIMHAQEERSAAP
jgi:MFS family permease